MLLRPSSFVLRLVLAVALVLLLMACTGPSLPVPPPPTRDPSQPLAGHNHQHGEGGGVEGRLITVYGGPLKSSVATDPGVLQANSPFTVTYTLQDGSGKPVEPGELQVTHEKLMHLIIVSKDLQHFSHIHPDHLGEGRYAVAESLPTAGDYLLFNEFFTADGKMQLERNAITAAGSPSAGAGATLTPNLGQPQQVDGLTTVLNAYPQRVRRWSATTFTLSVSKDGNPVSNLEPYLGAPAHVVLISADTMQFAHTHGDVPGGAMSGDMSNMNMGNMAMPTPPAHFGPNLQFTHTFMQPGFYRLWVQFGYEGRVVTVGYNVQVSK